jgi:hypothetical protein
LYGSAFIIIVLYLPKGIAGLYEDKLKPLFLKLRNQNQSSSSVDEIETVKGES